LDEQGEKPEPKPSFVATLAFASGGRSKRPYCVVKCSRLGYNVTQTNEVLFFTPLGNAWEDCACVTFRGEQVERNLILAAEEGLPIRVVGAGSQVYLQFVEAGFTFTNVLNGTLLGVSPNGASMLWNSFSLSWAFAVILLGGMARLL